MKQEEIIEMARHIATTLGSRMCDENGDTHGEELYVMHMDDIIEAIKLVAAKEREACEKAADDQWVRDPNVSGGDAIRARSKASSRGEA
jgi:hypothetical protein